MASSGGLQFAFLDIIELTLERLCVFSVGKRAWQASALRLLHSLYFYVSYR